MRNVRRARRRRPTARGRRRTSSWTDIAGHRQSVSDARSEHERPRSAGTRARPRASTTRAASARVVGRVGPRGDAQRRRPMYSGRGSSTCGVFAITTSTGSSARSSTYAPGTRPVAVEAQRAVGVDAHALEEVDVRHDVAAVEPVLGQRDRESVAARSGARRARRRSPYFAALRAGSTRRRARRGVPHVSATIDRSTRPMSESSSDPGAEVGLPLHLHGVGDVEALERLRARCTRAGWRRRRPRGR